MFLLKPKAKSYMYIRSPTAPLDLTLGGIERSKSSSHLRPISRNKTELGHLVLLNICKNSKSYVGSEMAPLDMKSSDFERLC